MIPSPAGQEHASKEVAFVYLLRNTKGRFYLGWTTDIERRLNEHNEGKSFYTRSRGPWKLISFESFSSISEAKKRERAFKKNPRMMRFFKKRALAAFKLSAAMQQQSLQVMG